MNIGIMIQSNKLFLNLYSRYLATGESLTSLSFLFRISQPYITRIVKEVFRAIKENMFSAMMQPTREQFVLIANEFFKKWNFPNVIGCLDGKHVRIRCPNRTGSLYYNYKDFFSIVLLALVDANYRFIAVDIGSFGREGDAGISFFFISTHSHIKENIIKKISE